MIPSGKISLIRKNKGSGKYAWYLRKSARVNGKPRVIWEKYLGSPNRIAKLIEQSEARGEKQLKLKSYPYGRIVALLSVSDELNFIDIVNKHTSKKKIDGLTVGEYLFLILLGRCHGALSKAGTGGFFYDSWLRFVWDVPHKLNSQNFLNHMKYLDEEAMRNVEEDLGKALIGKGLVPTKLYWDTTNTFTYIEKGEKLPKKGKSKQKRNDKNLVGLGLGVSEENIPFLHETFPGNKPDVKLFSKIFNKLQRRLKSLMVDVKEVVLVIDKGNNSDKNLKKVFGKMKVIGSVRVDQVREFLEVPLDLFEPLYENAKGHEITGYRTYGKLFDKTLTIVVTYNENGHKKKKHTYAKYKRVFRAQAKKLSKALENPPKKGRKITKLGIIRRMDKYIPKQYRSVFKYDVHCEGNGRYALEYWVDEDAEQKLKDSMGKQVLFSDCDDWTTEQIVRTYNGKYILEEDFKWMMSEIIVPVAPYFVRSDDMIRVHNFLCVLGVLFYRYLLWTLKDYNISRDKLVATLDDIRFAIVKDKHTKKVSTVIEEMDTWQAQLFSKLDLGRYLR